MYPDDRRYTREHEWAKREGTYVRIGVTSFAAERLSDVVFIELPKVGAQLRATEAFGVIESVKAASDLFALLDRSVTSNVVCATPLSLRRNPHPNPLREREKGFADGSYSANRGVEI